MSFDRRLYLQALTTFAQRTLPLMSARIAGRAVGTYMRDAKGEGRRDPQDSGPLRIVTGTLARSLSGSAREDAINKLEILAPGVIRFTKGSRVPYARIHELGGTGSVDVIAHTRTRGETTYTVRAHSRRVNIPARPYLAPAVEDELPKIRELAVDELRKALREVFPE
jgi:phage gpG-like protein